MCEFCCVCKHDFEKKVLRSLTSRVISGRATFIIHFCIQVIFRNSHYLRETDEYNEKMVTFTKS